MWLCAKPQYWPVVYWRSGRGDSFLFWGWHRHCVALGATGRRMLFGTQNEFRIRLASDVTGQVRLATLINRVMVQSWGQGAMMAAARLAPRLISDIADLTAHTRSN
jgi:hypothetical protein